MVRSRRASRKRKRPAPPPSPRSSLRCDSKLLVAAVAHRPVSRALAGAEPGLDRRFRLPFDRREARPLVRAVAERLLLRAPAGAPPVALAGLDIDRQRLASADFRFCAHAAVPCFSADLKGPVKNHAPPASVASQASPQALANSRTRR